LVGSAFGKIRFVFDYILCTAYSGDACALTGILLSLSLIGMMYFMADTKATPASLQGVGVNCYVYIDFTSQCLKRVRNRTARSRCVFVSAYGYGV
jgi:hypothetical protein